MNVCNDEDHRRVKVAHSYATDADLLKTIIVIVVAIAV